MPKRTAHIFEDKWRSDDVKQQEAADFSSLLLSERVLLGLKKAGFKTPSPIQLEAIPVGRFGNDLIVQAKSGTGKTLVFTIIALDLLMEKKHPQTLILAPTREIAFQICEVVKSVSSTFKFLKCGAFIGGIPIEEDRQNILGCQIVVGTPGRIKQLIQLRVLLTAHIRILVLDEADQLLDRSFQSDIDTIFVTLPSEKQIIATSATYPKSLKKLVDKYFKPNPYVARLNVNDLALLGTKHYIQIVEVNPMPVLAYRAKMRALENVLTNVNFSQCLVFCNAVLKVEPICDDIKSWGFSSTFISSAKEQTARLKAIDCLKRFKCKVLVSSDVTSRGIDAENVDLIINIDVPNSTEVYLHRVGRAGRFGSKGLAVTFVPKDQITLFEKIQKYGNFKCYFLPDPVPGNLINLKPDQEKEFLKEDSTSESSDSDEEPIPSDKKSRNSIVIMDKADCISNGQSSTRNEDKILQKNTLNSKGNSIENKSFKKNNIQVGLQSSVSGNSANKHLGGSVALKELSVTIENKMPDSQSNDATQNNNLSSLNSCKKDDLIENKESIDFQLGEMSMSLESINDEVPLEQLPVCTEDKFSFELGSSSSESKEYLEIIDGSEDSQKDLDSSKDVKNSRFSESKENLAIIDDSEIKKDLCNSADVRIACGSEFKENVEVIEGSKISQNNLNSNEVVVPLAKLCNSVENNETSIVISLKEDSTEKIVCNVNDVEVLESNLKGGLSVLPDLAVDALISNKNKLNANVELNSSLEKGVKSKRKNIKSLNSNTAMNSSKIDEVTACVINFIHDYETKNANASNDNFPEKPVEMNFADVKSAIEESVIDRKSLNDYYYKVYEAYRKDNVTGDPVEILELIKNTEEMPTIKENFMLSPIVERKMDLKPLAKEKVETKIYQKSPAKGNGEKNSIVGAKVDLNAWSLNLGGEKLSEIDSDSTDTSSECVCGSTSIKSLKVKNAGLDVSCDTPSFPNPIDESDTFDTSSDSEYSNKCQETIEKCLKIKKQIAQLKNVNCENVSSTSDSKSSSSSSESEDSTEMTLLERANREMLKKNNCRKLTLAERADIFRKVLLDLDKDGTEENTKESVSDIQITMVGHSPKALQITSTKAHNKQSISNGKTDRQCGFLSSFQDKRKSVLSTGTHARFEKPLNAKMSTKAETAGSRRGKNTKSSQRKLYRISSTSETSDDTESLVSSTSLQGKGESAANDISYLRLVKLSNAKKSDCSSVLSSGKNITASQRKLCRISASSETSSDDSESSLSTSSESNYSVKQKISNVHCRAKSSSVEYSHTSSINADQSNCDFTHLWNPRRHVNSLNLNPHGGFARSSHHTHKQNNSCSLPSQHQCHALNGHSACQSQSCATWYDLFYRQWNFIHQFSYFQ